MRPVTSPDVTSILIALRATEEPLGARQIRDALQRDGVRLSESTIARRLRELDLEGMTTPAGSAGRVLTKEGQERVDILVSVDHNARELVHASKVRTATDVLHLLKARRAIEPEAVADAAATATTQDVRRLRQLIGDHVVQLGGNGPLPRDKALDFHRAVTSLTKNPLVRAMLNIVLDASHDRVEAALDVILQVHNSDRDSVAEHRLIVEAISQHDGAKASQIMDQHLTRLTSEVELFVSKNDPDLLERLLEWHRGRKT